MNDNTRAHKAVLVDEYLEVEDFQRMDWPAKSPDLNLIEHVWDDLGRATASLHPPPRNLPELRTAFIEEWDLLS